MSSLMWGVRRTSGWLPIDRAFVMFLTSWNAETYAAKLSSNSVMMAYSNHEGSFYPRAVMEKCISALERYDIMTNFTSHVKTPCEEYRLQTCAYFHSHDTWAKHFSAGCAPLPPPKVLHVFLKINNTFNLTKVKPQNTQCKTKQKRQSLCLASFIIQRALSVLCGRR